MTVTSYIHALPFSITLPPTLPHSCHPGKRDACDPPVLSLYSEVVTVTSYIHALPLLYHSPSHPPTFPHSCNPGKRDACNAPVLSLYSEAVTVTSNIHALPLSITLPPTLPHSCNPSKRDACNAPVLSLSSEVVTVTSNIHALPLSITLPPTFPHSCNPGKRDACNAPVLSISSEAVTVTSYIHALPYLPLSLPLYLIAVIQVKEMRAMHQFPLSSEVVTIIVGQLTEQVLTVGRVIAAAAAKQFPSQQVSIILQEGQVHVAEKLHVFVLHLQLHWRVPVNDLQQKMFVCSLVALGLSNMQQKMLVCWLVA